MLNEDWFCILDTILMSTCIILTCILFTLFLIFKPLRTHPGELLILAAFFQVSWMFSIVVQQTSCYNIQIHIFITFGKIFIGSDSVKDAIHLRIQDFMANGALFYEMIVCLDLALAIYMPVYKPQRRNKFYHLAFVTELLILLPIDNSCNPCTSLYKYKCYIVPQWLENGRNLPTYDRIVNQISNFLYLIISMTSLIYFGFRIRRIIKVQNKIKSLIYRYFIYGIMFAICDILIIISEFSGLPDSLLNVIISNCAISNLDHFSNWAHIYAHRDNHYLSIKNHRALYFGLLSTKVQIFLYLYKIFEEEEESQYTNYFIRRNSDSVHIYVPPITDQSFCTRIISSLSHGMNKKYAINDSNIKKLKKKRKSIFTEIQKEIFAKIRNLSGISDTDILNSLNPILNKENLRSVGDGSGKSGSFFFFSHDEQFIIKIIPNYEKNVLVGMLENYKEYLKVNPNSLLCRICTLFSLKVAGMAKIYAILIPNTFYINGMPNKMKYIFDLKGSILNRYTYITHLTPNKAPVLKDINFIKMNRTKKFIEHSALFDEKKFHEAIISDAYFLFKQGIMDYSLILGIEKQNICSFAIIDYFQKYNYLKQFEHFLKILYNPKNGGLTSCINPRDYCRRFIRFIISITSKKSISESDIDRDMKYLRQLLNYFNEQYHALCIRGDPFSY